jgi:16S rRNA (uracil1498-N3)-methyltransferase
VNPQLRSSAAHVFVGSLDAPELEPADEHHLRRVLRITERDVITVSDGRGAWMAARLGPAGLVAEGAPERSRPAPRGSVLCAIPKGDRPELVVQKLTEIGVDEIGFVRCSRSVVTWPADRQMKQMDRLNRVAREAAMQSRRAWLPTVSAPVPLALAAERVGAAAADPDGRLVDVVGGDTTAPNCIVVGPEGGFTNDELDLFADRIRLGSWVLRIETAAIVAAVALQHVTT